MLYVKIFIIILSWYIFVGKAIFVLGNILFRERYVSDMRSITENAIIILSSDPVSIHDYLNDQKGVAAIHLKKELNKEKYTVDNDLLAANKAFVKAFCANDVASVKCNLSVLKARLDIIYNAISVKKDYFIRTKLIFNLLVSMGITIIII